jgi:CRISPR-associated protein Cas2
MFDLPTETKLDRYNYRKFREFLLDEGYYSNQFSIYYKPLSGQEGVDKAYEKIRLQIPQYGKIEMLTITDKQFENIRSFTNRKQNHKKNENQLQLF